jgi:GTP-binding protein
MTTSPKDLRNIAIIAHVDHGKTTLVDGLLRQTGTFRENQVVAERVLDSGDIERERGITIHAKDTSVVYKGVRIHLVDTPGHADFGGEVERVLGMVDSVLLLVDSVEGVMPQTRFVVGKALAQGLRPILVVNKIDRAERREDEVLNEVFDLLVNLGANDYQLDFPVVYASAKEGTASLNAHGERVNLTPLLDTILEQAPPPKLSADGPFQFHAVTLGYDDYLGRLVVGRVKRGCLTRGSTVAHIGADGKTQSFRITKLLGSRGLDRVELEAAEAGEICVIAGINTIQIGDTICDLNEPEALPRIEVDPPTVSVRFSVNTSPFAGQDGKYLTSRQIGERLHRETLGNVSIEIIPADTPDTFIVKGRGELQIAILIETLRREGYEIAVSRPQIIVREIDGKKCEPVEDVVAEVPGAFQGTVMEKLASRRGRLVSTQHHAERVVLNFVAPSRGLFGYRSEFLSDTRGEGVLYRTVSGYEPWTGDLSGRGCGAVVVTDPGKTTAYSLYAIQERTNLFIGAGEAVYEGQVIGENRRPQDMNVNAVRPKKLTNIRAAGKDESTVLSTPRRLGIEWALEWIADDELLEVTPNNLRLRKRILNASFRKRA